MEDIDLGISDSDDVPGRLCGDEGANLVEYCMLVTLIFIVCFSAVVLFGNSSTKKMSCVQSAIAAQVTAAC